MSFISSIGYNYCYYSQLQLLVIVYMNRVVLEVNVSVLKKGLELLSANGGRLEINQLLFADDTVLVADVEKVCRLVTDFGRVCERKKIES